MHKLAEKYGSNVSSLFKRVEQLQGEADKRNIPAYVLAELVYAIEEELAVTPVDFFLRRTGSLLFNINWAKKYAQPVIDYMAERFGWDEAAKQKYQSELDQLFHEAVVPLDAE